MIYLDNAATTALSHSVKEAIRQAEGIYGNPSSSHAKGVQARELVERVRRQIMDFLGAKTGTVIFTSGGSEANTLAIYGLRDYLKRIGKMTIITSKIEHPSVLNTCAAMEKLGFHVIYMPVCQDGRIDMEELDSVMREHNDDLGLVSIQTVNSEIGTVQNISDIGDLCEEYGVLFHTDAVQAVGHVSINVLKSKVQLLSMSGHKFHAPKGIGALYVSDIALLSPVIYGGGQEYGLRSGTENTIGIAALGAAIETADLLFPIWKEQTKLLHTLFLQELQKQMTIPYYLNGREDGGNIISLTIPKVDGEALMLMLDQNQICVSTGSACHAHSLKPSDVLSAIGLSEKDAVCTIRVSLSDDTTENAVKIAVGKIAELSAQLYILGQCGQEDDLCDAKSAVER